MHFRRASSIAISSRVQPTNTALASASKRVPSVGSGRSRRAKGNLCFPANTLKYVCKLGFGSMILTGWKQIASHLGYGTRTIQRWEQIGLPIKRVTSSGRSPVVADSEELDAWLLRRTTDRGSKSPAPWANIRTSKELRGHLRGVDVEFLHTEIQLGLTMAKIARELRHDEKEERNRANARKAYDTVLRFIPKLKGLTAEEAAKFKVGLAQLKSALQKLGEKL